jgi:hypothetical protein
VAGIIEGEGYLQMGRSDNPYYPSVRVNMVDEDVIRHLHKLVGLGRFWVNTYNHRKNPKHSIVYDWSVNGEDAIEVILTVFDLMHGRRKAKMEEILNRYAGRNVRNIIEKGML